MQPARRSVAKLRPTVFIAVLHFRRGTTTRRTHNCVVQDIELVLAAGIGANISTRAVAHIKPAHERSASMRSRRSRRR